MLTVYEAMQRRAGELAREREREDAARRQAEQELHTRERRAVELVRQWCESTQDFSLDGLEVTAAERDQANEVYEVSIRFPEGDGAVEGYFSARLDRVEFLCHYQPRRRGTERWARWIAGDVTDSDLDDWEDFDTLVDALAHAYHVGAGVPVQFPVEVAE